MTGNAYRGDEAAGYVIEFYMPKRLSYSGAIYTELKHQLEDACRGVSIPPHIYGYSLYEVDGAFINDSAEIVEDRTLVIRVFFDKRDLSDPVPDRFEIGLQLDELSRLRRKVNEIMQNFARISKSREHELWTFRYAANVYKLILNSEKKEAAK